MITVSQPLFGRVKLLTPNRREPMTPDETQIALCQIEAHFPGSDNVIEFNHYYGQNPSGEPRVLLEMQITPVDTPETQESITALAEGLSSVLPGSDVDVDTADVFGPRKFISRRPPAPTPEQGMMGAILRAFAPREE
ncbi:MAG: hypothetical protein AB7P76_05635 [Candidatus Melainabacteria bacterium]